MANNPDGNARRRARMMEGLHDKGDRAAQALASVSKEGVKQTTAVARKSAGKASETLERAQNSVTQSEAFAEINATLGETAFVIGVQHARISDLEARLGNRERSSTASGR